MHRSETLHRVCFVFEQTTYVIKKYGFFDWLSVVRFDLISKDRSLTQIAADNPEMEA